MVEYTTDIAILRRPDPLGAGQAGAPPSQLPTAAAVRQAAGSLVAKRLLLAEGAARLVGEAEAKGIRSGP